MDEYYNYKYKKYKTKYLDLKGGKMEYGLYGLYSYYGDTLNLRKNNKRFNEVNYVHDIPLSKDNKGDNIIINHLRSKCVINSNGKIEEYYTNIKSFEFVPYYESEEKNEDNKKIQELIDISYFTTELKKDDKGNVLWTELNKLKKFRNRGYSSEISEQIINKYADTSKELLKHYNEYKSDDPNITNLREKALVLQSNRRCDAIHKYPNKSVNITSNKLLLEDLIEEKQLLLSAAKTGQNYDINNSKIYRNPFTLVDEKLSVLSWNLIINKATINCIMTYHDVLFPIRIILDMNPQILFYDNIYNSKKYDNYMGFFLIRFENNSDENTHNSKPHTSSEQYYVFFIFKNESHFRSPFYIYTLTNFRNNIVTWGTVIEKKTVLYHEIIQLICMYLKNEVYFYLVSSINKSDNKSENYNNIKSWIHSKDLKYINFDNEIHILVSKHNIEVIAEKLQIKQEDIWGNNIYRHLHYNEYELIECHFGWYDDPNDKFCIKLGHISKEKKQQLEINVCIKKTQSELLNLDLLRFIQINAKANKIDKDFDLKIDKDFDLFNSPIMELTLSKNF